MVATRKVMMKSKSHENREPGVPSSRLLIAGLVAAIIANVCVIALLVDAGSPAFAGNLAAIVVCAGAIWIVRHRELFR